MTQNRDTALDLAAVSRQLDPPVSVPESDPIVDLGLSAETMMSWMVEMVNIPKWRLQADQDHDFYEVNQLSPEVAAAMKDRGQAPSVVPYCSSRIDAMLGAEARNRTGVRVDTAPGETTPAVAEALTVRLHHASTEAEADAAIAEAYHGQVVAGVDWVEVVRNADPFGPRKKVTYVPYSEMWWDWRSKDFVLLSDARYIVRRKRYDWDVILAKMPEVAPVIQSLGQKNAYQTWDYPQFGVQLTRNADVDRGLREEQLEWFSSSRRSSLTYEVWYRQLTPVDVFYLDDGRAVEFDAADPDHAEALARGLVTLSQAYTMKMRVSFWLGNVRITDEPTPYPHNEFPYVPFFAFREKRTGVPYGMMRRMRPLQEVINNTVSKIHHYMASNRVLADKRAFDDINEVKKQVGKPNYVIEVNADPMTGQLYEVKIDNGVAEVRGLVDYLNTQIRMFNDIAGVPPAALGIQSGEMAASAVSTAIDQGVTGMAKLNDNYRRARRRVFELLLALEKEELAYAPNIEVEVSQDIGGPKTVVLNARKQLEDGTETVENDVSAVNVWVVLETVPHSETYMQSQMTAFSEIAKTWPEDMQRMAAPAIMRMNTSIPGHDRIADMMAQNLGMLDANGQPQDPRVAGLQRQVQDLQQKLEAKHPQELVEAQIDKLRAETRNIEVTVKKTVAEAFEKNIEALFEAINTAKEIAANPAIAPVADIIAKQAGYRPPVPEGVDPNLQAPAQPVQQPLPQQQAPEPQPELPSQPRPQPEPQPEPGNTHPSLPAPPPEPAMQVPAMPPEGLPPNPARGAGKGIEGGQQPAE